MTYRQFEDLPVWKSAIDFTVRLYALTASREFRSQRSLRDQLERAAVSISNNIAEGFERGTKQELLTFIYIARGSSGEVRSMLCLLERLPIFAQLQTGVLALKQQAVTISKQLGGWATSLQNSDIKGQRYQTNKSRRISQQKKEREEFLEELRRMQDERIAELQKREAKNRDNESENEI